MALGTMALIEGAGTGGVPSAPHFITQVTLVGPASYTTGGDTGFQAALRALTKDTRRVVTVLPIDGFGYLFGWDTSTGKLKIYRGDNANGAAAPAVEVTNGADISAVTFKLAAICD